MGTGGVHLSMAYLLTGNEERLAAWAARRLEHVDSPEYFGECEVIGVTTGPGPTDKLLAVVVFHSFFPKYAHCQMSVAADDMRWMRKKVICALLAIPFMKHGCNKVWIATPHVNETALRLLQVGGFTKEATLKEHFGRGKHAVVCRMMARDYERKYLSRFQDAA